MRERTTAEQQLDRMLYLLPAAARPGGAELDELARVLDTTAKQLVSEIEEVAARAFHHRAGSGDEFQILLESGRVQVHTTGEFRRPVQLNAREAIALGLGLRVLAAESDASRRTRLLELAARLEHAYDASLEAEGMEVDTGDDDHLPTFADAVRERRVLRVFYLKPDAAPAWRTIEPYRLAHASGTWYVIARDTALGETRTFRTDRILEAEPLEDTFEVPTDFDARTMIREDGRVLNREVRERAVVRYSPRIAGWIAERMRKTREADGCVVVEHDVARPEWLVRHVLQYGAEAVVLSPESMRVETRAAAERVAERERPGSTSV